MHPQTKINRFSATFKRHETFLSGRWSLCLKNLKEITENNAIYQIQTIELNEMQFSIFYNSRYGNFMSTYNVSKRLGRNATQK